jgi:hypothetical protein
VYWGGYGLDFDRETGCPVVEDSGLSAYDAASLAEGCRRFRRVMLPLLSGVEFFVQLKLEEERIVLFRKSGNCPTNYTASHHRKAESIITPL